MQHHLSGTTIRSTLVAMLGLLAAAAWGAGYDYKTLRVEGALSTQATGINEDGVVVGSYQVVVGPNVFIRPFSFKNGVYTTYAAREPITYSFDDINAAGHVVVNRTHRNFVTEATLVAGDAQTTIAVNGAVATYAYALNDLDVVVGSFDHDPNALGILTTSAYLRHPGGRYTRFDAPGSAGLTMAWGVNRMNDVVGVYADASLVYHGFVRKTNGRFETIDIPHSPYTQLMGINARRDIVGFYQDPADFILRGFAIRDGEISPVVPPRATNGSYPYRISEGGDVVGWYIDDNGAVLGFIATPRP